MMDPAVAGCAALLVVVAAGCLTRLNVGVLAAVLAAALASWAGLGAGEVVAGVPWLLAVRLCAITALSSIALVNGTLDRVAGVSIGAMRERTGPAAPLVFCAALTVAVSGAGNFAAASLVAPVAMVIAHRRGISPVLMSVMVVYGATAGAFSPVAPTGLVAHALLLRGAIPHSPWTLFLNSLAAHALVALTIFAASRRRVAGHAALGGLTHTSSERGTSAALDTVWTRAHRRSAAVLAAVLFLVLFVRLPIEWVAGAGALALLLLGTVAGNAWVRRMPWRLITAVTGVSLLAAIVNEVGGLALVGRILAASAGPAWLPGSLALVSGLVSVTASSIGVVLPALLPAVGDIFRAAGGGDVTAMAYSISVGAHLVDISPLSPLGALCVASVPADVDRTTLTRHLMRMGLVMCPVGAVLCQALFG